MNLRESRSPDGDGPHGASSRGPFRGVADAVTDGTELQAGQQAWEPQGARTTSRKPSEKGGGDARYEASMPGSCSDEARQKDMGLHPNPSDAHVLTAGSEPADSHQSTEAEKGAEG